MTCWINCFVNKHGDLKWNHSTNVKVWHGSEHLQQQHREGGDSWIQRTCWPAIVTEIVNYRFSERLYPKKYRQWMDWRVDPLASGTCQKAWWPEYEPQTYKVEWENQLPQVIFWLLHVHCELWCACPPTTNLSVEAYAWNHTWAG